MNMDLQKHISKGILGNSINPFYISLSLNTFKNPFFILYKTWVCQMRTPFIWFLWGRKSSAEVKQYKIIGLSWCNKCLSWCNKSLSWCNKSSIFEIVYNFGVKAACCIVNSTQLQQRDELLMCEPVYMEDMHQLTIAGCY